MKKQKQNEEKGILCMDVAQILFVRDKDTTSSRIVDGQVYQ